MGGRGSASSGAGAGAGGGASAGGSIKSLEAQKKALGDKMASLVRQTDKDGQITKNITLQNQREMMLFKN